MKQWLLAMAGSLVGVAIALVAYDVLVAKPRERQRLESMRVLVENSPSSWQGAAVQREQAREITREFDESISRSMEGARDAMQREAELANRRALVADGLMRASLHKLAVAESYLSNGRLPSTPQEAGLSDARSYAAGAVISIALDPDGSIGIRYGEPFAPGAEIRLRPAGDPERGMIEWQCESSGFEQAAWVPASCR